MMNFPLDVTRELTKHLQQDEADKHKYNSIQIQEI